MEMSYVPPGSFTPSWRFELRFSTLATMGRINQDLVSVTQPTTTIVLTSTDQE